MMNLPLVFFLARGRGPPWCGALGGGGIARGVADRVVRRLPGGSRATVGGGGHRDADAGGGRCVAGGRGGRALTRCGWLMGVAIWLLAGSYNFILLVCLAPAGAWLALRAWARRDWRPAARVLGWFGAVLAGCALLFWGRFDGSWSSVSGLCPI